MATEISARLAGLCANNNTRFIVGCDRSTLQAHLTPPAAGQEASKAAIYIHYRNLCENGRKHGKCMCVCVCVCSIDMPRSHSVLMLHRLRPTWPSGLIQIAAITATTCTNANHSRGLRRRTTCRGVASRLCFSFKCLHKHISDCHHKSMVSNVYSSMELMVENKLEYSTESTFTSSM